MVSRSRRLVPATLLALLVTLIATGLVAAHANFVRSEPAADSTVAAVPQRVVIYFSDLLDAAGNSIQVTNAGGASVTEGNAALSPTDAKVLQVSLRSGLAPGKYTVNWVNKSPDGHSVNGSFTFNIAAAPTQLPTTGAAPLLATQLLLAGLALLAAGLGLRRR